jgi:hypothetical protein
MALPRNPNQGGRPPQRPQGPSGNSAGQGGGMPDLSDHRSSLGQSASDLASSLRQSANSSPPAGDLTSNDRLGQYDFEAQRVARPTQNTYDDVDPFESLEPADAFQEDEQERPQPRYTPAAQESSDEVLDNPRTRRQTQAADQFARQNGRSGSDDRIKPQAGRLDKKGQNTHIDEEQKKLKPFGGKKSLKVADLDRRKNLRSKARAFQFGVIGLLGAVILVGGYNALVPKPTLTANDVRETVQQTVKQTDFPIEGGRGFAVDFMQSYLTLGTDANASAVLNYYYNGRMVTGNASYPNRANNQGYGQDLVYGPTVYGATYLTDNSANYTIGALIQPRDTSAPELDVNGEPVVTTAPDGSTTADGAVTAEWQFFSVNVYYDPETLAYAITPESPTLVPKPQNISSAKVPEGAALGTGEELEDQDSVKATVLGFMEGYRTSTPEDHIRLDQYLVAKPAPELLNGLGETYEFGNEGVDGAVTYTAYMTATNEIKTLVNVVWQYDLTDEVNTTYKSQYVMTLEPSSTGFVVTKFAPYLYTPES